MTIQKEILTITTPHVEGDEDIGGIRDIVGFHIRLAHGAVYRHFMETFSHLDLTQKQVSVLWLVDDHPDIAQTGLAKRMRMDRATTMAIVKRLETRGYLRRKQSRTSDFGWAFTRRDVRVWRRVGRVERGNAQLGRSSDGRARRRR